MKRTLSKVLFVLIAIFLFFCVSFMFMDDIIVLIVNNSTSLEVSYEKCSKDIRGRFIVDDMKAALDEGALFVYARKADIRMDWEALARDKVLALDCDLEDVTLEPGKKDVSRSASPEDNVFSVPFLPGRKYDKVSFRVELGHNSVKVNNMLALSPDVRIKGDYVNRLEAGIVNINIKISVSPAIAHELNDIITKNMLSEEDDGWYSTVINFEGNPVFLKALY
ncbi:MAG: hypothetical protein PHH49_07680 [Candidatus Omnitrophica bacterium]|nr:hypothetical protein [Candidatus Omnitrophota bacterium]MDD5488816.1 hypothetical protein [Candidatus Omnitrophota bacterium]